MKNKNNKSSIEGLLVLLIFGIFAVCIMMVLLTGAGAYKRLVQQGQDSYATRTVPHYLATKIRQADESGAISVGEFGEAETLEITETIGEKQYVTRIYCYEGYIRELFSVKEGSFEPTAGEPILEAEKMELSLEDGCLMVEVTGKNGVVTSQKLMLRSTEGGNWHEE